MATPRLLADAAERVMARSVVAVCIALSFGCSQDVNEASGQLNGEFVRAQSAARLLELTGDIIGYPFACSDGTILFGRIRSDWSNLWTLWELPAGGGEIRPVIEEPLTLDATRPSCSPDSRLIVFRLGDDRGRQSHVRGQLRVLDRATGELRSLTDATQGSDFSVVWSPAGDWLVVLRFQNSKDANRLEPTDTDLLRVWMDGRQEPMIEWPTWEGRGGISPDGHRMLFVSYRPDQQSGARSGDDAGSENVLKLWEMDPAVGESSARILDPRSTSHPFWSPDGNWISFTSDRDGYRAIYLKSADGTKTIQVSEPMQTWAHPSWTADGTHLITEWQEPGDEYSHYIVELDVSAVIDEFSQTD